MSAAGDAPRTDVDELVRQAKARAEDAAGADEIRSLADDAIQKINALAEQAITQASKVEHLLQRLAELRETDDEQP